MTSGSRPPSVFSPSEEPKRNHLILMVAFFFLIGCASVAWFTGGAWLWALAGIGLALGLLLWQSGLSCAAGVAVVCFALGSLHAHAAMDVPAPPTGSYEVSGFVYGESLERSSGGVAFALGDLVLNGEAVPGKAYCTLNHVEESEAPALFDGAQLCFTGYVYHPEGKSGEPRMDFRLWMRQQGYAFGVSSYEAPLVLNTPDSAPIKDAAHRVRQVFAAAFERTMGANGRIAMALLFGQRDGLTAAEYEAFQDLGIAHVMSVSGLHVGLVGGLLMLALERFPLKRRTRLLILAVFLLDYCALTGFSAASVRAAVMLLSAGLGRMLRRRGDPLTTLAAAMLAVLVIDPLSALSAGFALSFSAMLGIVLFGAPVQEAIEWLWPQMDVNIKRRTPKALLARVQQRIKSLLVITLTAQAGVLLPTMRYFQQLPLYGIVINLLIVPLVGGVLVPLYAAALLCSLFPFIGTLVGALASRATDGLLWLVGLFARLPCAAIRTAAPPVLVCLGLGCAFAMLSRRVPGRSGRRLAAAVLAACVTLGAWALDQPSQLRYIQLSVGQADAALLLDGQTTVVIDTGEDGSAVLDYLLAENREVDVLILTHLHMDHAGGAMALVESGIPIHQIFLPVNARHQVLDQDALLLYEQLLATGIPMTALASGDELRYNRSAIRVLWPERETVRAGRDANHYSLALAIELDGFTLLNAGDLSGLYERYAAVPADVLKAAHHGSSDSTSAAFLDFVSPACVLLSTGSGNRALPGAATLERLQERDISVLRTNECGDITLSVQNGVLTITPYKERTVP